MLKKIYIGVAALTLAATLTACQSNMSQERKSLNAITGETKVVENQVNPGILIAYFPAAEESDKTEVPDNSNLMTDNLGSAAQLVREVTGGIDYRLGSSEVLPEDYGTIFLGFSSLTPDLPETLIGFLEQNDFSGKTIIPFVAADGENHEEIISLLYEAEPESEFLDEFFINGAKLDELTTGIEEWLSDLGYHS